MLKHLWHVTSGQASLLVPVWLIGIMTGAYALGSVSLFLWSLKGPEARGRSLESLVTESDPVLW